MRRGALVILCAACAAPAPIYRPTLLRTVDTESEKVLSIVEDTRLDNDEAQPVDARLVTRGMLGSGMFTEEDANQLAAAVAGELSGIGNREYVRIVGWAEDAPRIYYVFIHGGKLRFLYYRGGTLMDTAETLIPADSVAIQAPEPTPPLVTPPPPAGPPDAAPPQAKPVSPVVVAKKPKPPAQPGACAPTDAKGHVQVIDEDQARKRLHELDRLLERQLITRDEFKCKRKDILARL